MPYVNVEQYEGALVAAPRDPKPPTRCRACIIVRDGPIMAPTHLVHLVTGDHMLFDVRGDLASDRTLPYARAGRGITRVRWALRIFVVYASSFKPSPLLRVIDFRLPPAAEPGESYDAPKNKPENYGYRTALDSTVVTIAVRFARRYADQCVHGALCRISSPLAVNGSSRPLARGGFATAGQHWHLCFSAPNAASRPWPSCESQPPIVRA